MAVLYLDEYGATLRATHERLIVEKDGKELASLHPQELELVIVLANCGFTSAAAQVLLEGGIDVAFLDQHGDYLGRLEGASSKNVLLRKKQYALTEDADYCMAIARAMVRGKLLNMRTILMRYARAGTAGLEDGIHGIAQAQGQLEGVPTLEALLGLEGVASAQYFVALRAIIQPPFVFDGRNRRPPQDPVNAMLGFGYAMLLSCVERAVSTVGLDVYCGFLHQDHYGRMSLGLDLMEELRSVLADSVVIAICNRHILDPAVHFEARDGGVFLNELGRKAFVQRFHARMRETVDYDGRSVTYYQLCVEQARILAACIREGRANYPAYLTK